jgi:hypothetical protein
MAKQSFCDFVVDLKKEVTIEEVDHTFKSVETGAMFSVCRFTVAAAGVSDSTKPFDQPDVRQSEDSMNRLCSQNQKFDNITGTAHV